MPDRWARYDQRHRGRKIKLDFPYDEEINGLIKEKIPGWWFDSKDKVWRCPLSSLPEVMEFLVPKGFLVSKKLIDRLPEIKRKRKRKKERREKEKEAKERFEEQLEEGKETAYVPAGNAVLTRKLKEKGVYEVVKEKNYFGQQVAGIRVPEEQYLEVLDIMDISTKPESLLTELLYYTWQINTEAKDSDRSYSSGQYRYMKKGYLLDELCRLAAKQDAYEWGWKMDPDPPPNAPWVLYFQREGIQCSFHSVSGRGEGPDFPGEWDGEYHNLFPFWRILDDSEDRLFE